MIDEYNPNHIVTRTVHDHWHKIVAILLARDYNGKTEITEKEIEKWSAKYEGSAVVIKDAEQKLILWLVDRKEAERLAKEEGGLPA